ncbi:neuropeptide Y receptor type 1-like [Anneissia japonica]|uniref:neuropeptide Y receptor type 1-like n=1 Tax=Anneissia japonica TaxID=1529436 RepID=UPI001425968A|nr:neuropeptide Y receptor type 1-like [Anneissia japonica]XP_033102878.1 neuropeptide Y receptor type 1-like [Anneissia japonica]
MEDGDWEFYGGSWIASFFDEYSYYGNYSEYEYISHDVVFEDAKAYLIMYILTIVISFPGNLCIVLSVWRNKALNAAVWYMLGAISLSLTIQNITIPFFIVHVIKVSWTFGPALCRFLPFVHMMTITFTCISLAAMCIIRLLSHSVMKRSFREHPKYKSAIGVGIIAVISLVFCIPTAIFHSVDNYYGHKFCGPKFPTWRSQITWHTFHFIVSFAVPFIILWLVNPLMYFYRRKFFSAMSTETVSYVRQYDEAQPFNSNNQSENGDIRLNECGNTNSSNGHAVLKDDFSFIVGTIDVNSNVKSENQVTSLLFMLALSFTLLLGPMDIIVTVHYFGAIQFTETVYKMLMVAHILHIFFPASIPLISFAVSTPLRQGIIKPIRNAFPTNILYTKV